MRIDGQGDNVKFKWSLIGVTTVLALAGCGGAGEDAARSLPPSTTVVRTTMMGTASASTPTETAPPPTRSKKTIIAARTTTRPVKKTASVPTSTPEVNSSAPRREPSIIRGDDVATALFAKLRRDRRPDDLPMREILDCPQLALRVGSSGTCRSQGESWRVTVTSVDTNGTPTFSLRYRSAGNRSLAGDRPREDECGSYANPCDGPTDYDPDSDIAPECLSTSPPSYCPPQPGQ